MNVVKPNSFMQFHKLYLLKELFYIRKGFILQILGFGCFTGIEQLWNMIEIQKISKSCRNHALSVWVETVPNIIGMFLNPAASMTCFSTQNGEFIMN